MALLAQNPSGQKTAPARLLALALLAAVLPACGTDNPACIFGPGTCFGGGVGIGANPAFLPEVGQIIRDAAPGIQSFAPTGTVSPTSPIVITFTESIAASTVSTNAFRVTDSINGFPVQVVSQVLADGQVLVLLPTSVDPDNPPLMLGQSYQVVYDGTGMPITDITGQELEVSNTTVGTFTVLAQEPSAPSLMTTYPPSAITNAPVNSELIVVFDAPVLPSSTGPQNLNALVDGMALASAQAAFQPLSVTTPFGGGVTTDPRVYTFRQFDLDGNPALLASPGAAGEVEFQISNDASPLQDFDMPPDSVMEETVSFTLSDLYPPVSAMIVSLPNNAIGIANLIDPMGGEGDLALDVSLVQGLLGDDVNAFLFGRSIVDPTTVISVVRTRTLEMDFNTTTFGAFDLALSNSQAAIDPIFQDGEIGIAFRHERGGEVSPIFVLDVEPSEPGLQDPVFDTTRPELAGLGTSGSSTTNFASRFRDLTLVGRASEQLRAVSVSVEVGGATFTNGMLPPVVGSSDDSLTTGPMVDPQFLFIAAPVELPGTGALDPADGPRPVTVQLLDRALNESTMTLTATFEQIGSTAPGAALSGPTFTVQVFDAGTLQPVANAVVATHQDVGGVVTPITMPLGPVTDADGIAEVPAAPMGETIVTVDGQFGNGDGETYDLFTLHGVTTDRISIPLRRTESLAFTQGIVAVSTTESAFSSLNRTGGDTRAVPEGDVVFPVNICTSFGSAVNCTGATVIQTGELGAASALGSSFPSSVATYSAQSFLRAFVFDAPSAPTTAGVAGSTLLELDFLLDDPLVDDEELGINWTPEPVFDPTTASGIDLMMLDGDPEVAVQANVPGLAGSATVGAGVSFDDGMGGFDIRAAYAGAVDPVQDVMADELGSLVVSGTIEPVLRLRTEISESDSFLLPDMTAVLTTKRTGTRARLDQNEMTLQPLGIPEVQSPTVISTTPADGYDIVVSGVIDSNVTATGRRGLYVANLIGDDGRRWTIYRPDQSNAPGGTVTIRVPSLTVFGGSPLADGLTFVQVSAYAWEDFDLTNFFWTDIQREYELFGHSAPSVYN